MTTTEITSDFQSTVNYLDQIIPDIDADDNIITSTDVLNNVYFINWANGSTTHIFFTDEYGDDVGVTCNTYSNEGMFEDTLSLDYNTKERIVIWSWVVNIHTAIKNLIQNQSLINVDDFMNELVPYLQDEFGLNDDAIYIEDEIIGYNQIIIGFSKNFTFIVTVYDDGSLYYEGYVRGESLELLSGSAHDKYRLVDNIQRCTQSLKDELMYADFVS